VLFRTTQGSVRDSYDETVIFGCSRTAACNMAMPVRSARTMSFANNNHTPGVGSYDVSQSQAKQARPAYTGFGVSSQRSSDARPSQVTPG
jgi:hypothetical protein